MGRDKGLLDFGGVPLILHTARLLEPLVAEVTVVGSPSRYASLGLHTISDMDRTQAHDGPDRLGRWASGGNRHRSGRNAFALEFDRRLRPAVPFGRMARLAAFACARSRAGAVIPRTERGIEPLAAVYRRECRAPIAAALARGVRKVSDAIAELRVEFVYPREWRRIEPSGTDLEKHERARRLRRGAEVVVGRAFERKRACQEAPAGAEAETAIRSSPA